MAIGPILSVFDIGLRALTSPKKDKEPKEEPPKEEKKEEVKPEPEKKRSGGVIKSASKRADGIAIRGKTRA